MRFRNADGEFTGTATLLAAVGGLALLALGLFGLSSVTPDNGWAERAAQRRADEAREHHQMMIEAAAARLSRW